MAKFQNSKSLHKHLVDDAEYSWELGLLAFAIMEDRRFDWMKHFEENNKRQPNDDEIQRWYEDQSQRIVEDAIADAETTLQRFHEAALEETIEDLRNEAEEHVFVSEIRMARRFWPQFGIGVSAGIVSTVIFTAALLVLYVISTKGISHKELAEIITQPRLEGESNAPKKK